MDKNAPNKRNIKNIKKQVYKHMKLIKVIEIQHQLFYKKLYILTILLTKKIKVKRVLKNV